MKKFGIVLLIMIVLLGQASTVAYGENVSANIMDEKYELLKEENLRLRDEILKLRNQLSEKEAEKIPVLMYHHLLKQEDIEKYNWSKNSSVLSVETFEKQMDYLYENGFYTATLDELQSFIDGEIILPEKSVVITFDDGYYSNALYAYPIMKKYNFRGTIFMLGYRVDNIQALFDPSDTQSLSVNETYKYEDVFDYESHTYELHDEDENGEKLIISSDKETIINDLIKSKELLNAKYFAYPYGAYDENTIEYLKQTGYEMAFTIEPGYVTKDLDKYELTRFSISPNTPLSRFKRIVNGIYE
ncbi:polysaccharide deacetylase family protein [Clostridium sp. Cult2]|uniref:polysaccharide deacetylase family protein n=1 Tax=Clostridium sp. Cult2 TaxID=2079003 RepID=UPI001F3BC35A|nr:polysaccharide deacetylase family protein [Clostridium sp. Cult2]MCF6465090.1 polysaccharide deacetylase family protein [Clostridium sp. Cult2]